MSTHLTLEDRIHIAQGLEAGKSIYQLAKDLLKDRSTISREIRKHALSVDIAAPHRIKNRCIYRRDCQKHYLCADKPDCTRKCASCSHCNHICPEYKEEQCSLLMHPPYVCNGCLQRSKCVLKKVIYKPQIAQKEYEKTLKEAREGLNMTTLELRRTDEIVSPLLKQGQSIHHIYVNNNANLTVSESTIARLIKANLLRASVLDQPRVVKLKLRKAPRPPKKVDRQCRKNRCLSDYFAYIETNPDINPVQMDTVIGRIGGKCLLTFIFPKAELMLAFLCNCHTAANVQLWIDYLYSGLKENFSKLFPVILTDNGSEFSNPAAIETAPDGSSRTKVFFCNPMASWQKSQIERNHEFIRLILPKRSSFDNLSQQQVGQMMSHINSYARPSLADKTPFEMFSFLYGQDLLNTLLRLTCQTIIQPENIVLKPSLLS